MRTALVMCLIWICGIAHAAPRPRVFVSIASTSDASMIDAQARRDNEQAIRVAIADAVSSQDITRSEVEAKRLGLEAMQIDASVTKWSVETIEGEVEISAQVRIAVSSNGQLKCVLGAGAKVRVPKRAFRAEMLGKWRKEVIADAVKGMAGKLRATL